MNSFSYEHFQSQQGHTWDTGHTWWGELLEGGQGSTSSASQSGGNPSPPESKRHGPRGMGAGPEGLCLLGEAPYLQEEAH